MCVSRGIFVTQIEKKKEEEEEDGCVFCFYSHSTFCSPLVQLLSVPISKSDVCRSSVHPGPYLLPPLTVCLPVQKVGESDLGFITLTKGQ
jgi:hypothetical protein